MTTKSGHIRAVARALNLLDAMNERQPCSLAELHHATGLPKPTVFRILATLEAEGYVRSEGGLGQYRLTARTRRLGAAYSEKSMVIDVGGPIALTVTKAIKWPLAIGVLDGDAIVVRHSTMPYSPLAVQATTLGHRLGLLDSAMGQTYLAFCDDKERSILVDMLCTGADAAGLEHVQQALEKLPAARERGYGLRLPKAVGVSATVAVPILRGSQVPAVLSMTTFGRVMNDSMLATHLPVLRQTATDIALALAARESQLPG
jgi:IclR family mhp operon transcriptional activator